MSKQVDERIVSMEFDNKRFEQNISTSMSTLDKLKSKLNFSGIASSLGEVDAASKGINFNPLSQAVETIGLKFNAMQVMAITALTNITNSAINAGKRMASALTIDPIRTGLQEYETQINAVQTILANTSSKGTTLEQVNNALDELNHYADMTIYNFTEMTRNIGTFTAAGVDLDTSVSAIKGIANLAAVSGSTSMQASTAMYQLSQALAAGKVQLMDWNSIVNAGMGGQVFQDALKETARVHNIAIDDMITSNGSFRETLQEGWLTSEIMLETLKKFTGDLSEEQLKSMGYTEEQIKEIIKMGEMANNAATKVKTFTQLVDTLKEAAQSGWTQTWEILIGDFEEAKKLWTGISDYFSEVLNKSAESRNNLLQGWADKGGRTDLLEGFKNSFKGILSVINPIKEAFREIFPKTTVDQLLKISERIKEITSKMKLNSDASEKLKNTAKGLFSVVDIGLFLIKNIITAISKLTGSVVKVGGGILDITSNLGIALTKLRDSIKQTNSFGVVLEKVVDIAKNLFNRIITIIGFINKNIAAPGFKFFYSLLENIWKILKSIGSKIGEVISKIGNGLKENLQSGDFSNLTNLFKAGGFYLLIKYFINFIKKFKIVKGTFLEDILGIGSSIKEVFESIGDAIGTWQENIKIDMLMKMAGAIALLAGSVLILASIDKDSLYTALTAISALFAELLLTMSIFTKIIGVSKNVMKAAASLVSMSTSILILAVSLKILSTIDTEKIFSSLIAMTGIFVILLTSLKVLSKIDKDGVNVPKLMPIAMSLILFASALKILSTMSWGDIIRSITTMAVVFAILLKSLKVLSKIDKDGVKIPKLIPIAISLVIFASALKILSTMSWEDIGRSLTAMTGVFAILLGVAFVMSKIGTVKFNSASILALSVSLVLISTSLKILSTMDFKQIASSVGAIVVIISQLTVALMFMGAVGPMILAAGAAMIAVAIAINLFVPAIAALGVLPLEVLAKGIISIVVAMSAIAAIGIVVATVAAPAIPILLGLAGAMTLIGIAVLSIGVGLFAMGVGITTLATSFPAGMAAIVAGLSVIIQGIINLIPFIITTIVEAIISILRVIGSAGDEIFNAVKTILVALFEAIIAAVPLFIKAVVVIVESLLDAIVELIPKIIDSGIKIVLGILDGISSKIGDVIDSGVKLIDSIIKGVVLAIPKLIVTFETAIYDVINAIAEAIRTDTHLAIEAFNNLLSACAEAIGMYVGNFSTAGKQIVSGFIKGIKSSMGEVKSTLLGGVSRAWNGVTSFFGIHSPSRRAAEAGRYIDEGLSKGLTEYSYLTKDAAENLGKNTYNSLSDSLNEIQHIMDSDINPTIRPVMDLTDVEKGVNKVNDMFDFNPILNTEHNTSFISSNVKNQNGNNDYKSLIDKIEELIDKDDDHKTNVVYNINGITYDDGTAVADAVGRLIKAAKIERRI